MIGNILDNTTELYMIKYTFGEIFSSGEATLYKNPSDQTAINRIIDFLPFFFRKKKDPPAEPLFAVGTNLANEASDGFLTFEHVTKAITCTDQ